MFNNISQEGIELACAFVSVVVFFVGIVINGIVIAVKEGKEIRKSNNKKNKE